MKLNPDEIKLYEVFEAIFDPRTLDDLREGSLAWVGKVLTWTALWKIDAMDGGAYVGEWAMGVKESESYKIPFVWVPSGDLTLYKGK